MSFFRSWEADRSPTERDESLNRVSEQFGAYLLMAGLIMEANDLCFEPVLLKIGLAAFGIGLMVALDRISIVLCLIFLGGVLVITRQHARQLQSLPTGEGVAASPSDGAGSDGLLPGQPSG